MQHSPGPTAVSHKGAVGRLTVLSDVFAYACWPDHRGPARAEDEISKLVFYERLIVSGSLTGAALARE